MNYLPCYHQAQASTINSADEESSQTQERRGSHAGPEMGVSFFEESIGIAQKVKPGGVAGMCGGPPPFEDISLWYHARMSYNKAAAKVYVCLLSSSCDHDSRSHCCVPSSSCMVPRRTCLLSIMCGRPTTYGGVWVLWAYAYYPPRVLCETYTSSCRHIVHTSCYIV